MEPTPLSAEVSMRVYSTNLPFLSCNHIPSQWPMAVKPINLHYCIPCHPPSPRCPYLRHWCVPPMIHMCLDLQSNSQAHHQYRIDEVSKGLELRNRVLDKDVVLVSGMAMGVSQASFACALPAPQQVQARLCVVHAHRWWWLRPAAVKHNPMVLVAPCRTIHASNTGD